MALRILLVLLMVVVVAIQIYTIIAVVRSTVRRKWAWIALALLCVTSLQLVWTSGAASYNPLAATLLGFSIDRNATGLWVLSVGVPLGAILTLRKVKSTVVTDADEGPRSENAAVSGESDHGV